MDRHSDLILDSKLDTRFESGLTVHSYRQVSHNSERRVLVQREEYWRQIHHIGSGAYGSVWLEKCVQGHQDVESRAIKKVSTRPSRSGREIDYNQELKAVAKFSHDKYVHCFIKSFGWYEGEGNLFIAMEYLPHGDLQQYLSRMPPLLEEVAGDVIYQILEGLSYMHGNSFAHRDLKPGNILIKSCPPRPWWVKIGDFGISKRLEEETAQSTLLRGTPGFIAPELYGFILAGTPFAADMWSLGEITFRLMTKQPVFENNGLLARYAMQSHPFPSTDLITHNVSTSGQDFISSLMVALPDWRLTAEAALTHRWISRYLPSTVQSSSSSPMTRALPATHSINEVFAKWNTLSISDSPPPDLTETLRPRSGNYQPVGGSSDPRLTQQEQAVVERATEASTPSLETRGQKPEYVASSTHTSRRAAPGPAVATAPPLSYRKSLPHHPPIDTGVRSTSGPKLPPPLPPSRSGRNVLRSVFGLQTNHKLGPPVRGDVREKVTPITKGTYYLGALSGHAGPVHSVAFSPDGATIASCSLDQSVRIWDASTGKQLRKLSGHTDVVMSVVFSPDGAIIASGSHDELVRIWDASTGKQLQEFRGHTNGVESVVFSPDGATIASGSTDTTIKIWSRAGEMLQELRGPGHDYIRSVAFSPDSATIAFQSVNTTVSIWNVSTGKQLWTIQGSYLYSSVSTLGCVAFSPDGATLASVSSCNVRIWDVSKGTGLRGLSGHKLNVTCVAFSPNGATIASGSEDQGVRIWDAGTGKQLRKLKGHTGCVSSVAFSPDGDTLVSGSYDRTVRIWDVGTL